MSTGTASPSAISISGISKRYGRLVAVRDLILEVAQGEVFGFLGLNGAGKTTTIRILLDLLRPTSGNARLLGLDCQSNGLEVRSRVGYLTGELGLYGEIPGSRYWSSWRDFAVILSNQDIESSSRRDWSYHLLIFAGRFASTVLA